MNLEIVQYKVTGETSLLMDNPSAMLNPLPTGTKAVKTRNPEQDADRAAYKTPDGLFYIPSLGFRSALLSGTKQQRCGKVSAMGIAMAAVFTAEKQTVIINPETGKALTKYTIDTCRGVNPNTDQGIVINRPEFLPWGAIVKFKVDMELLPELEILDRWFNRGGCIAGVGAFRIENKGEHGRFSVKRI